MKLRTMLLAANLLIGGMVCGLMMREVKAAEVQKCNTSSNCVIGEFLYDDSYQPINVGATCTLTSRKPDGTIFLNGVGVSLPTNSDGWYSYNINTAGKTEGVYPTNLCCTVGLGTTEYMCQDKTFAIGSVWNDTFVGHTAPGTFGYNLQTTAPTAGDVWSYSGRTLTGFGTLIADIWAYTDRSLTSFGSLVSSIWSNSVRTLTHATLDSGQLASQGDVTGSQTTLSGQIVGTQTSLASAVTIIQGGILGTQTSLAAATSAIRADIATLDSKVTNIGNTVNTLVAKWGSYSASDILGNIDVVKIGLGSSGDTCSDLSIFAKITCVKDKWGTQTADALYNKANSALTKITELQSEMDFNGKSATAYTEIQAIKTSLSGLDTAVTNTRNEIANVQTTVDSIESRVVALDTKVTNIGSTVSLLLAKWGAYSVSDILAAVNSLNSGIGNSGDVCGSSTVFGSISCIRDKWGTQTADALYTAANGALTAINSVRTELNYNGKSTNAYDDVQTLKNRLLTIDTNIGSSTDSSAASTIFGKVKANKEDIASAVSSIKGSGDKDLTALSGEVAGVKTAVDSIQAKVDTLLTDTTTLKTNVSSLLSKWSTYTVADVLTRVGEVQTSVGVSGDVCSGSTTLFGHLDCVQSNSATADNTALTNAVNNVSSLVTSLRSEVNYNGKSTTAYADLETLKTNIGLILTAIGNTDDAGTVATLFGRLKKVQSVVDTLNGTGLAADETIDKWGSLSAQDIYDKVKDLTGKIAEVNTVTNVSSILTLTTSNKTDLESLKNQLLSIKALTDVNKTLLERTSNQPVIKTWLEEGSIIFKTMITNPSSISQSVPFKYYLPKEAKKEDVIKIDKELIIQYDPKEDASFVAGNFELKPKETKIVAIEITDVWRIEDTELSALKKQAEELTQLLKNTSFFAQSVTLKSNILVQAESINRTQDKAITPDSKISTYRQNLPILGQIKGEIKELQGMVSETSGSNSLMGFVGGAQAVSLWGILLILIIGIVFLSIYIRVAVVQLQKVGIEDGKKVYQLKVVKNQKSSINPKVVQTTMTVLILIVCGTMSASVSWWAMNKLMTKPTKVQVVKKTVSMVEPTVTAKKTTDILGDSVEKVVITVPEGAGSVKIRSGPDETATIVGKVWSKRQVDKYNETDGWVEIGTTLNIEGKENYLRGWIKNICLEEKND